VLDGAAQAALFSSGLYFIRKRRPMAHTDSNQATLPAMPEQSSLAVASSARPLPTISRSWDGRTSFCWNGIG